MKSATGSFGTIVLFGGTSELGLSTVEHLLSPSVRHIVLVSRDIDAAQTIEAKFLSTAPDAEISHVRFDGADSAMMQNIVDEIVSIVGDIDVAIIAHALLGQNIDGYQNPNDVKHLLDVNVTATMALMYALAARIKAQKHGTICLYSSVAGVRVRKANAPYGASKAAIDAFALALGNDLRDSGVSVVVVRPGFVLTKMTTGMKVAPFATTPDVVGEKAAEGVRKQGVVVWVPGILRIIFGVFRVLPEWLWRRLPIHD
jgi:decaprenylphospho-beta-D-erythro-pentofuranosid-2-ulose 2-reductase